MRIFAEFPERHFVGWLLGSEIISALRIVVSPLNRRDRGNIGVAREDEEGLDPRIIRAVYKRSGFLKLFRAA